MINKLKELLYLFRINLNQTILKILKKYDVKIISSGGTLKKLNDLDIKVKRYQNIPIQMKF